MAGDAMRSTPRNSSEVDSARYTNRRSWISSPSQIVPGRRPWQRQRLSEWNPCKMATKFIIECVSRRSFEMLSAAGYSVCRLLKPSAKKAVKDLGLEQRSFHAPRLLRGVPGHSEAHVAVLADASVAARLSRRHGRRFNGHSRPDPIEKSH
ncbi:hypothetical protein E4U60_006147 [Claviceps pazoutovae]|uniref:Uncharacterized protein n=1 Tax=Claviceps pazoutovae TaxID=1649127 RepID=A0A9P7M714_9HYPO|nr:hypothetical protein E4U60_006147 [Claviceps pazoutovae]